MSSDLFEKLDSGGESEYNSETDDQYEYEQNFAVADVFHGLGLIRDGLSQRPPDSFKVESDSIPPTEPALVTQTDCVTFDLK